MEGTGITLRMKLAPVVRKHMAEPGLDPKMVTKGRKGLNQPVSGTDMDHLQSNLSCHAPSATVRAIAMSPDNTLTIREARLLLG